MVKESGEGTVRRWVLGAGNLLAGRFGKIVVNDVKTTPFRGRELVSNILEGF